MDLNKLAAEVEAAGWHCDKPGAEKLIRDALARVQRDERERCAQVAGNEQWSAEMAKEKAEEQGENGFRVGECCGAIQAATNILNAIRALNNAQGEQG